MGAAAPTVERAERYALRVPEAKGERAGRPAVGRWMPGSRGRRAGGGCIHTIPLGVSLFWAAVSWNRKYLVFHVHWWVAVLHLPASTD